MIKFGDQSFLGGGLFAEMFKDATIMGRNYIYQHSEEFIKIIEEPSFDDNFSVKGVALKIVPKEYPPDGSVAQYLKYKNWYVEYSVEDSQFDGLPTLVNYACEKFLQMKPFNDFINKALVGFVMPTR